jgi:hypothetical protein
METGAKRAIGAIAILALGGCAAVVDGGHQEITVNTTPAGADCSLERNGVSVGRIQGAPSAVTIEKSKEDLTVVCKKDGYQEATYLDKSGLDGWIFGNILIGGLIGIGIDMASGSWNQYDSPVNVTLLPVAAKEGAVTPPPPPQAAEPGKPGT